MKGSTARAVLVGAMALFLALPAAGQVSFEWSGRFGKRGLLGKADQLAWHDFGSGPQLCAAHHVGNSGAQIARVTAGGWQPLGPVLEGVINDLISFDAGSGPVLYASGSLNGSSSALTSLFKWSGTQWTPAGFPGGGVDELTVFDFGAGPRLCTFSGSPGTGGLWTFDGTTWTLLPNSAPTQSPYVALDFAAFNDGTGLRLFMAYGTEVNKWTGTAWQTVATVNGWVNVLEVFDDGTGAKLYAAGSFTQINGTAAANVARWNGGISWSQVGTGVANLLGSTSIYDLLAVPGPTPRLVVAGVFTNAGPATVNAFAAWNGTAWSGLATTVLTENGTPGSGTCLAVSPGPGPATLYVGGNFDTIDGVVAHHVASRPVQSAGWTGVPTNANGAANCDVTAVTVFDAGGGPELVVAGDFSSIGGVAANRIARWNGITWQPLGAGIDGIVMCMTAWNDGTSTALYAAGQFTVAGGVSCINIAKWNGTAWSPLGTGLTAGSFPPVWALMALDGPAYPVPYLVVGGSIGSAGGSPVSGIAAWTGSIWVSIGGPDWASGTGHVKALAVFDDGTGPKIYAAGHAGAIGGTLVNGMQQWNGFSWSTVPGWTAPLTVVIWDIEVFDDGQGPALYVSWNGNGGTLTKLAGGVETMIANGNNLIRSMRGFDDGDGPGLYLGGSFTSMGGVAAPGVARYRSGVITPLGTGVTGIPALVAGTPLYSTVRGLEVFDDGSGPALFAVGNFATAGGLPSFGIGQWGAGAPILDVSQLNGAGGPAFVHCGNLQTGREYFNVISAEVCGGSPGSGPYLGLCASDPMSLISQLLAPLETPPFHFLGTGTTRDFGPYPGVPPGLTLDALTLDVSGTFWRVSAVDRITFQ